MRTQYSEKYKITDLIDQFCTKEWKLLMEHNQSSLKYDAEEKIFKEGEKANDIKILLKGKAKIHCKVGRENEQILRLASNNQILGHRAMCGKFIYQVSATALSDCQVLSFPMDLFLSLLKANNEFCFQFMLFFAEELNNSEKHMRLSKAKNLEQRVATAVLDNIAAFGYDKKNKKMLAHVISRKEFSDMSNTSYESIVRTFKKFEDQKILIYKKAQMEILDEKKLFALSLIEF